MSDSPRSRRPDAGLHDRDRAVEERALALAAAGLDWLAAIAQAHDELGAEADAGPGDLLHGGHANRPRRPTVGHSSLTARLGHSTRRHAAPGKSSSTARLRGPRPASALAAPQVRRSADDTEVPGTIPDLRHLDGGGQPLPSPLLAQLEAALGFDLAAVRVHTDAAADDAARALGARAFAVGRDLGFRAGAYDPSSPDGVRLIAHEVAHTTQDPGPAPAADATRVSQPADPDERAADAFADRFAIQLRDVAEQPTSTQPTSATGPDHATRSIPMPSPLGRDDLPVRRAPDPSGAGSGTPRPPVPGRDSALPPELKLLIGFSSGFARTAGGGLDAKSLAKIRRDFTSVIGLINIHDGYNAGVPLGVWKDLKDNGEAVAAIGKWIFWNLTPAGTIRDAYEWVTEPAEKAKREAEERQKTAELAEALWDLAGHLAKEPGFVADLGADFGEAVGEYVARSTKAFADAQPYRKGRMIGEAVGYVAMELVLLLLGPEVLIAKAPAAIAKLARAGGRASEAMRALLRRIPSFKKVLKTGQQIEKTVDATADLSKLAHLGEELTAKLAKEALTADEVAALARLDKAVASKALEHTSGRELAALESKFGPELCKLGHLGEDLVASLAKESLTADEIAGIARVDTSVAKKLLPDVTGKDLAKMEAKPGGAQSLEKIAAKRPPTIARIAPNSLPAEEGAALARTMNAIDAGTTPTGPLSTKWGTKFNNWNGDLPGAIGSRSPYREYRVAPPPGVGAPGARRVVVDSTTNEVFYTWTHYGDGQALPAFVKVR